MALPECYGRNDIWNGLAALYDYEGRLDVNVRTCLNGCLELNEHICRYICSDYKLGVRDKVAGRTCVADTDVPCTLSLAETLRGFFKKIVN